MLGERRHVGQSNGVRVVKSHEFIGSGITILCSLSIEWSYAIQTFPLCMQCWRVVGAVVDGRLWWLVGLELLVSIHIDVDQIRPSGWLQGTARAGGGGIAAAATAAAAAAC